MSGSDVTSIGVLISSIKQTSIELFLCLCCEGIIKCEIDNLGPLVNIHRGLRPGAVAFISNCALVLVTPFLRIISSS